MICVITICKHGRDLIFFCSRKFTNDILSTGPKSVVIYNMANTRIAKNYPDN